MNTTCFTFSSPSKGHAAWAPDPSCRGTFGIISLCLSTTTICIWSSIHWNIPLERLDAGLTLISGWSFWDMVGRLRRLLTITSRSFSRAHSLGGRSDILPGALALLCHQSTFPRMEITQECVKDPRPDPDPDRHYSESNRWFECQLFV